MIRARYPAVDDADLNPGDLELLPERLLQFLDRVLVFEIIRLGLVAKALPGLQRQGHFLEAFLVTRRLDRPNDVLRAEIVHPNH